MANGQPQRQVAQNAQTQRQAQPAHQPGAGGAAAPFPQGAPQQVAPGPAPVPQGAQVPPSGPEGVAGQLAALSAALTEILGQPVDPSAMAQLVQAAQQGDPNAAALLQEASRRLQASAPAASGAAEMGADNPGAILQ